MATAIAAAGHASAGPNLVEVALDELVARSPPRSAAGSR
jgi:hypothetical protein